jgi:pyrroline-5-carboxylate reductase
MGSALFAGWTRAGLAPSALVDPSPTPGLARREDSCAVDLAALPASFAPSVAVLAVKPQMASSVLPDLDRRLPQSCPVLSIMAGLRVETLAQGLGGRPIIRAMPNTPAAIGQGMSVACAGPGVTPDQRALCGRMLATVGAVDWIEDEALMDGVTAVSGSGPAYVFLLAELLEAAAVEQGIAPALARTMARQTVAGAGALLAASAEDAAALRRAVTSPGGTTERALQILMHPDAWPSTVRAAVAAAASRSKALAK